MAPFTAFPTFKTHKDYMITEGTEPLFIFFAGILVASVFFILVGICYGGLRFIFSFLPWVFQRCSKCPKCCQGSEQDRAGSNDTNGGQNIPGSGDAGSGTNGGEVKSKSKRCCKRCCKCCCKCSCFGDVLQSVLSSFFNIIEIAEEEGTERKTLLFAKRRGPKNPHCYRFVLAYFIILMILISFLFLCMFSNFLLYRKSYTCNDINVKTEYSICFDIKHGFERVQCTDTEKKNDPDLEVICYLTDFSFFRALGTAFGAIQAVRVVVTIFFPIGITMGLKWPYLTVAFQIAGAVCSLLPIVLLYSIHYTANNTFIIFLNGDPPLVHLTLLFACITAFAVLTLHPWWAFKCTGTSHFEQVISEDDNVKHLKWKNKPQETHKNPPQQASPSEETPLLEHNVLTAAKK